MFSKKSKIELDQQAISTLISEGCVFDGNMKAPAFVRIEGQINEIQALTTKTVSAIANITQIVANSATALAVIGILATSL